jgi:hypothetical protein
MAETSSQRQRRQELERQERVGITTLPAKHFNVKVVGVTFVPSYPANFLRLEEYQREEHHGEEPIPALLRRNPANAYDSNAIEVHIPALGDSGMIGHIPAPLASRLAPEIDDGVEWSAHIERVVIHPDHTEQPGMWLQLDRIGRRI